MSNPIVIWSGGVDSTLVLAQLLKEGTDVYTGYIKLANNKRKTKRELKVRKKIKKIMKCYPGKIIEDRIFDNININHSSLKVYGQFNQPPLWALGSAYLSKECSEVIFGYVKGDDFWGIYNSFELAFKSLYEIIYTGRSETPKVSFPLKWDNKHRVYQDAIKEPWFPYCWTCENPKKKKPCCDCLPCEKHIATMKKLGMNVQIPFNPDEELMDTIDNVKS